MSYIYTYLAAAANLVKSYQPPQPLHLHLKKYFAANKKHGSRDRKLISALCYTHYRMGQNFADETPENKMLMGLCLCHPEMMATDFVQQLQQHWPFVNDAFVSLPLTEKIQAVQQHTGFEVEKLFPHAEQLSGIADKKAICTSMLQRPLVWLRMKKGKREKLEELLATAKIQFENHARLPNAIGLPQQTNIEQALGDRYYHLAEIQDASSQFTGEFIALKPGEKIWDCCCGAGGKSLMLRDKEPKLELYCSDVRPQILQNLHERFRASGLPRPFTAVRDITTTGSGPIQFENKNEYKTAKENYFDAIVADVPCSGSGTWARTPEQAFYFTAGQIETYAARQQTIVSNAIPYLKKGGRLYYITCSVYAAENEGQLPFFEQLGLKVEKHELIEGWHNAADTMFIACLVKA